MSAHPSRYPSPVSEAQPPRLIATPDQLAGLVRDLKRETVVAVDTEAASFHRHQNRIYLIQVSSRSETSIVDPLAVEDLSALGRVLSDPAVETVFHDADYDLRLLHLQYGISVQGLFDTRVAAEFLNEPGLGLAALLEKYLEVKIDKRFQRADWSLRPLSDEMMAYAATDTRHLVELRDLMATRLEQAGRMAWAEEEFRILEQVRWTENGDREPAWLRIKSAKSLQPRQLAILRELQTWRQAVAEKMDRAEFRIVGNEALLEIARQAPESEEALAAIKGVGKETLRRRGRQILAAVRRGLRVPAKDLPRLERKPRPRREPEIEGRISRLKQARGRLATRLALPPGVVCPNSILEAIARANPDSREALAAVPGVRQWQVEAGGDELLAAVRTP